MTGTMTPVSGILSKEKYFAETGYLPHDAQKAVHYTRARHKGLSNGRRWGKTLLGGKEAEITAWVKNRLNQPQRGWIVGPNYIDCEKEFRVVHDSLRSMGVDQIASKFLKNVDNGNMHITLKTGWDLECRSAAHPETLVGEGLDFVILVEAGRLHRKTFTEYIRPALSDKRGWSLATGVPEVATDYSLLYWFWKNGQNSARPMWKSWQMPSWTNLAVFPGGRKDPEILEAEDDLTKDEFDRQYGGQFVERVGRVMQEWDDSVHLRKVKYNPKWPLYWAVDYGYTNPFVILWIQVDEFDNVYIIGENYITLRDTEQIARDMVEGLLPNSHLMSKVVAMYPDPAEPDDTSILSRITGIAARQNTGGERKIRDALIRRKLKLGPEHVEESLRTPGMVVDEDCTSFAWEMREGYRWPEHKSEVQAESEKPLDKDNHGPEALGRFMKGYFDIVQDSGKKTRIRNVKYGR